MAPRPDRSDINALLLLTLCVVAFVVALYIAAGGPTP